MKTKGSNEIWGQVSLNKTNDQLHNLLACHHELLLFNGFLPDGLHFEQA